MNRILRILPLLAAATLMQGCCFNFHREWRVWSPPTPKESRTVLRKYEPAPTPQSPFDGRWEGRWTSQRHRAPFSKEMEGGNLKCVFTQIDPYRFRANFRAEWLLGASQYLAELYGHQRGNTLHLKGQANAIVPYTYEGTVTPNRFTLSYDSSYDTGTFEMRKLP